ncbi:MAG: selenocysteine-specific translation elongation factor, partial [Burkholderiales bacterium]|nr:selenocysteine-specific translation elongation factor [Burkholderiales bacterium]
RTMVAGASGIDFVLFVVAADDGPMPQTREHLAILDLLNIREGAIVITKTDRASADRVTEVSAQMRMLTNRTFLDKAPIYLCCSTKGIGIGPLAEALKKRARESRDKPDDGYFRLAIDRAFTLPGAGLVVTGSVHAGRVEAGNTLKLSPKGAEVRVRGVRSENLKANCAQTGQRCALNITGRHVHKDDISRGDWIVAQELHAPTSRLDVRVRLMNSETRDLRHWTPVHLHIGALDATARLSLLDSK